MLDSDISSSRPTAQSYCYALWALIPESSFVSYVGNSCDISLDRVNFFAKTMFYTAFASMAFCLLLLLGGVNALSGLQTASGCKEIDMIIRMTKYKKSCHFHL